ncbi:unannotated protein [freshwater metagenome]|uniref:Unannotated protein n=1 Tax=freshwater metagenome TaxID=449393 RepID=A0A6J6DES9_9ZZZZ
MVAWFSHASGIIIRTACGSDRPPKYSNSNTSSKDAESDPLGFTIGSRRERSPGISSLARRDSLADIQLRFPRTVLISPLCAM